MCPSLQKTLLYALYFMGSGPSLSADVPDGVLLPTPEVWNAWLKKTDPHPDYLYREIKLRKKGIGEGFC